MNYSVPDFVQLLWLSDIGMGCVGSINTSSYSICKDS